MKTRDIFLAWDFLGALCVAGLVFVFFAPSVSNTFVKDLYGVGISVLSIVFSVYFAALAIIISSGDNDFVRYLQSRGYYRNIIDAFKLTLIILFLALIYSIVIYSLTSAWLNRNAGEQNVFWFIVFAFCFTYGLFATANSVLNAIKYAEFRVKFLMMKREEPIEKKPPHKN